MYIDTHAHLTDEAFKDRIQQVVEDYRAAGVGLVINVGYDLKSSAESAYIAQKYDDIYFLAGLHPTDGEPATPDNLAKISELLKAEKCLGIGEIGLDYHWECDRAAQKESFYAQLELAVDAGVPVSIHARDCAEEMLAALKIYAPKLPACVLHCYSLGAECAKQFLKYGCTFAFGGAITFKNNKQIYEVAKVVPKDRLLTETDCPYMAPVPHRGEVNEPKYVGLAAEKLAEIYGLASEEMQEILYQNTRKTFGLRVK